jgi:hypothetical protein
MKLPKKVRVLGQDYVLNKVSKVQGADDDMGSNDGLKQVIELLEGISDGNEKEVLLHEVIHIIDYTLLLNLTELQVNNIAVGINQFLSENNIQFYERRKE